MEYVLYLTLAFGFYMAWSIGSNDAANAMGTSVGSKAITFKEAVIIAAVFEFGGAILAGGDVTDTIRKGIIGFEAFNQMPHGAEIFAIGMMSALVAAAIWIHIAAFFGWPVSTTHSIVGAVTGFGVVSVGVAEVDWMKLGEIVASWGFSPVLGGLLAFLSFSAIRKLIFDADDPVAAVKKWSPVLAFPVFVVLALVTFFKGLSNIRPTLDAWGIGLIDKIGISAVVAILASGVVWVILRNVDLESGRAGRDPEGEDEEDETESAAFRDVERVFRYLQVITACFVAFAHGSNDVANSIGPLAAVVNLFDGTVWNGGALGTDADVAAWVLALGGLGIVIGLATYGYRVIKTIGTKITDITPSRGFAAEFGAATTIMIGTKAGIPLSTTHTVVGSVIGVGFARGMNALNLQIIWDIVKSWIYTIPFTAILTMILFYVFQFIFI